MISYTKVQILEKVKHLKSIASYTGNNLFTPLESAITSYFERGSIEEFKEQGYKTFKKVVMDGLYRNIQCTHMELLPLKDSNYPVGYEYVGDIFQDNEAFQEIMEISDTKFNSAFKSEEDLNEPTNGNVVTNTYITSWITIIKTSNENEMELLKNLERYCLYSYEHISMAFIFEELGDTWNTYTENRREFAQNIYIEKGWDWFEQTFNVGIFLPSYIEEIR